MAKDRDWSTVAAIISAILVAVSVPVVIVAALILTPPQAGRGGGTGGQPSGQLEVHHRHSPTDLLPDPDELDGTWDNGEGPVTITPKPSDDDGELHDGWDDTVSYTVEEEHYQQHEVVDSEVYGIRVQIDVDVAYPQLVGAGEHTEAVNEALREAAMSYVDQYVTNPSDEAVTLVRELAATDASMSFVPDGVDAVLSSEVSWSITYNTDDFVSVSFSDEYYVASYAAGYIQLRCVNANLSTGELYAFDDVLSMNEEMAREFVDALATNAGEDQNGDGVVSDDESFSVAVIGREEWMSALMGEGAYAHRMAPTFFVDEKGRVNLGVTYWLSSDRGIVRGWWDATLSDEVVESACKDSTLWELLEKVPDDG